MPEGYYLADDGYYYPADEGEDDGYDEAQDAEGDYEGQERYETQQNDSEPPAETDRAIYQQQQQPDEATKTEAYEPVEETRDVDNDNENSNNNNNDDDDDDSDCCCKCVVM